MSIKPADGIDFPITVPVLAIGGGACGLTAVLASGFIPAAGTRFQRAKGIADSPALLTADLMAKKQKTERAPKRSAIQPLTGMKIARLR